MKVTKFNLREVAGVSAMPDSSCNAMKITRFHLMFAVLLFCVAVARAEAKDAHYYQNGYLAEMSTDKCGYEEKGGKGFKGMILGTDEGHKHVKETLCQEYIIKADKVIYHVRPKTEKTVELLPVGESAQFRLKKDRMLIRLPDSDKEREFVVLSMTPVERTQTVAAK